MSRPKFTIKTSGIGQKKYRLTASRVLSKSDFKRIASELGSMPVRARKKSLVAARKAERREKVDTHWNGQETTNTAHPGDFVVTSLAHNHTALRDRSGSINSYVIRAKTFAKLYASVPGGNKFGRFYAAVSVVTAIYFSGGFDILAPWGRRQRALKGYLLLNGNEVYGNNAETFEATYAVLTT